MPRYNKERHDYGTAKEKLLQTKLQKVLGEELTATADRYCIFDWESCSSLVELKSRRPPYTAEQFSEWLLPSCKADYPTNKRKVFFYYWESGNKLYRLDYDADLFKTFKRGCPRYSEQEHLFVPAAVWREVKVE